MRFARFSTAALLVLAVGACSKDDDGPTAPSNAVTLSATQRNNLQTQLQAIAGIDANAGLLAQFATLILSFNGNQVSNVNVTSNVTSSLARLAAAELGSPNLQTGTTSTWQAVALDVALTNSTLGTPTVNLKGVFAFKMSSSASGLPAQFAYGFSPTGSGTIGGTAGAVIVNVTGNGTGQHPAWLGTGGSVNLSNAQRSGNCSIPIAVAGLTCSRTTFTGALNVSSSAPLAGTNATGTPTLNIPSQKIVGLKLRVDCAQANQGGLFTC